LALLVVCTIFAGADIAANVVSLSIKTVTLLMLYLTTIRLSTTMFPMFDVVHTFTCALCFALDSIS